MKITIYDWIPGSGLTSGHVPGLTTNAPFEGTDQDAVRIAGDLFSSGVNVMLKRNKPFNKGTRKNPDWTEESITIFVDDQRFGQR